MSEKYVFLIYRQWSKIVIFLLEKIVNIYVEIEGIDNIPATQCILAFQHQSAFDTIIPSLMFNNFSFALKKELFYIPFLRTYLFKLQAIFLDRKKGVSSIKKLLHEADKVYQDGKSILIYPQGSRINPKIMVPVQPGVFALYKHLNAFILPISINSGYFWKRRGLFKSSGIIKIIIHPVIEKDLSKENVLRKLETIFYKTPSDIS